MRLGARGLAARAAIDGAGVNPAVVCFALAAFGLFLRAPDALLNPQLIAEDGTVYFAGQLGHLLPQLFASHQGYLVVMPRLMAWVASFSSALHLPFVYGSAAIFVGATSIAYFCWRARVLFHPYVSLAVILLLPTLNGELFGILANSQWFSQLAIVAASLLPRPEVRSPPNRGLRILEVVFIAALALTGPFAVLCAFAYFGLLLLQFATRILHFERLRAGLSNYIGSLDEVCLVAITACALVLVVFAVNQGNLPAQHGAHVVADFFRVIIGQSLQAHLFGTVPLRAWTFFIVQCALLLLVAIGRTDARTRAGCIAVLGYGWLCLAAGYFKMSGFAMPADQIGYIDRYFFALAVFQWLVAWRMTAEYFPGGRMTSSAVVISALVGLGVAYPYRLFRAPPPDLDWPAYARRIDAGEAVEVPINPAPWRIHVPARTAQ